MPPQPELFASSLDTIIPEGGRRAPRLWVRRLVIWSQPGKVVRDIALRPGLNVVWSPDADASGNNMGHGGGKTSFCRLLRYCLGEDSFGTADQRQLIANAMSEAHVGAEIMLDDEQWIVVRPIGNPRGRHLAQKGGQLDTAFVGDMPNTTLSPLRKAIAETILGDAVQQLPVGSSPDDAWQAALAWLSRDQECRLLDILEWRAVETQSRSPTRDMSKADRLAVVRLLIDALQPAEIEATRRAQGYRRAAEEAERKKARVEATRTDVGNGLSKVFGTDAANANAPDLWTTAATSAAKAEEENTDAELDIKLKTARQEVIRADTEIRQFEVRIAGIEGEMKGLDASLKIFAGELPKKELKLKDAVSPKCPECGQPITVDAAEFIAARKAERDEMLVQQTETQKQKAALNAENDTVKYALASARQALGREQIKVAELEAASARLAAARGYVTLTDNYKVYGTEIARLDAEIVRLHAEAALQARSADELRRAAQGIVQQLSAHFDAVVRFMIPGGARGDVTLAENGIHPSVRLHGNMTTAAVDSLKVVAFDLAVLILAIEGKTHLPAFWLHDSPREADLGLPLYHRLFALARHLEAITDAPLFQYVITTTTEPPAEMRHEPWLVLQLSSVPAERRLFGLDL